MVNFNNTKSSVLVSRNLAAGTLNIDFDIQSKLQVKGFFEYSMANNPLRVVNSFGLNHLAFTEKSPNAKNKYLELTFDGKQIESTPKETALIYDFTAGYLKRNTEWYWSAFSGRDEKSGKLFGGNFAINNNYPDYSENGLWVGNKRFDFSKIKFDFQNDDPIWEWYVYSLNEKGKKDTRLEMTFTPGKNHYGLAENINLFIIQSYFKQYFGQISGVLKDRNEKITFNNLSAISEKHTAKW